MGRHGPLTSLALGRSPYDQVIQGDGDGDPLQLWDERGRPWNPVTRKINKDVIRSHNEVMLVIGVAEPENGLSESQMKTARLRHRLESAQGRVLNIISQHLELFAMYGVNGLRQRIMIYKRYSEISFHGLLRYHRMHQSIGSYVLTGFRSWLLNYGLERAQYFLSNSLMANLGGLQLPLSYLRLHLTIFGTMQRAGLLDPTSFLPNWRFFVPGSDLSPITIPHLPASFTWGSAVAWLRGLAVGMAPFVGLYLVARATAMLRATLGMRIYHKLPHPGNRRRCRLAHDHSVPRFGGGISVASADPLEPPFIPDTGIGSPDTGPSPEESFRAAMAGAGVTAASPLGAAGASPSPIVAFSQPGRSGGDEFGSDDDETEVISATLISFDVEATEALDTPPGWCAELRPNVVESSGAGATASHEPLYRQTALTMLPAALAARTLAFLPTHLIMEPLESAAWCGLVRSMLGRRGVPLDAIRQVGVFSGRGFTSLLGLDLLCFFAQAESWAVISMVAKGYMLENGNYDNDDEEELKIGASAPSQA